MKTPGLSIEQLERGDIAASDFDHEGHVYLAWLYIGRFGADDAIRRFSAALIRLTGKLGVPDKYHATITRFYLHLIAERFVPGGDWATFRNANPDLFARKDNVLGRYYSRERLSSEQARKSFLLPDRIAA